MRALGVIDMHGAFGPGGGLAVPGAMEIIPGINKLMIEGWRGENFAAKVGSYEEHLPGNLYLASTYPNVKPNDRIIVNGMDVYCWIDHGMSGTWECEPLPGLRVDLFHAIFRKGYDRHTHPYSSMMALFMYGSVETKLTLAQYLKDRGIIEIIFVGLAFDFCVGESALEAVKLGFKVTVIKSLTGSVFPHTEKAMMEKLIAAGVEVVD
ncbi:MAG: isochorismatase family protein [Patescibacteria group bacterium]